MLGSWLRNKDDDTDDIGQKLSRKCGSTVTALESCLGANRGGVGDPCHRLKTQLVYCRGMVLCEKDAAEFGRCMERVVRGKKGYEECDDVFRRMERCLACRKNKEILQSRGG